MAKTTVYVPVAGWSSGSQKLRLKVEYETSGNATVVDVTPMFSGNRASTETLYAGTIKYSTDGGGTKYDIFNFATTTSGGNYPYAAPLDASEASVVRVAGTVQDFPTTRSFTVYHGDAVTITFYVSGVKDVQDDTWNGNGSISVAGTAHPVYLYVDGAWQAHEAYVYGDEAWEKHRPYIYLDGQWVPHG